MERKLKKLLSVIVSYALIFSMMFSSLAVVAADTPQYSIENKTVKAGKAFTVDVNLENATDVFGGNFTLQYDSDLLEVSEYSYGDILSNHTKNCNLDYQSAGNLIRFTFSGSEAVGTDGVVLSLTFTAKEETEDVAELTFNSYKLYGTAGTALSGSAVGAEITIEIPETIIEPTSIALDSDSITASVGGEYNLSVTILPEDCTVGKITWESSDEAVVTVDSDGLLNFVGAGTAKVTVSLENGLSDEVWVEVLEENERIKISVGDCITKTVTEEDTEYEFVFTPTESGTYKFYSEGELDTYAYMYGAEINANAGGEGDNFAITYDFEAGTTYTFRVKVYDIGDVTFVMEEAQALSKVEIESYPTNMTYYEGLDNYYSLSGLKLKLTLEDGTVGYWTYGWEYACLGYQIDVDQDDRDVVISCGAHTLEFSFELIENPVESIEVLTTDMPDLIEHVDGWWSEDVFIYDLHDVYEIWDVEIQVNYTDGTSATGYIGSSVGVYSIDYDNTQYDTPFTLGSDNYIVVTYAGKSVNLPITIVENPVEKLELISAPTHVYIVGDERYGSVYEGTYEFSPTNLDGFSFKAYYTDGTEKIYTADDMYEIGDYDTPSWYLDGHNYDLVFDSANWVIGENTVTFEYMNHTIDYTITIQESTVSALEVIKAPVQMEYESRYNPFFEGMQVKITYTDNTSKIVEVTEENMTYCSPVYGYCSVLVDGYEMLIWEVWNSETDMYVWTMSYLGVEYECTELTFVENREIKSIEISGSYLTGEDVVLDVTYTDGTQEQLELEIIVYDSSAWYPLLGMAITKNGTTDYTVTTDYGNDDEILGYYVYVLDEEVYIPLEEEEPEVVTDANIVVSSATTNQGKQVKVTISLENNPGIISARLNVHYDSSVMTLVGIEDKGNLGATMHSNQFTNPYVLSWANDTILENIVFNGDIVTLVFDVAEDAQLGEYAVSVSYDYDNYDICNFDQEKVKFNVVDGVVSVVDTIIGDVNGDGAVNTLDRIALARYLANWEGYTADTIDMIAADVNGDGAVNTLDRIALARHLGNWEGYEELPYIN